MQDEWFDVSGGLLEKASLRLLSTIWDFLGLPGVDYQIT